MKYKVPQKIIAEFKNTFTGQEAVWSTKLYHNYSSGSFTFHFFLTLDIQYGIFKNSESLIESLM